MSIRFVWLALLCWACGSAVASGQAVQLPTFHVFSVETTVSAPDRGAVYLGGVAGGRSSASYRGAPGLSKLPVAGRLFGNRGIAAARSASSAQVSATIIDLQQWDRAVLAEAAARRGQNAGDRGVERKAAFISRHVARTNAAQ